MTLVKTKPPRVVEFQDVMETVTTHFDIPETVLRDVSFRNRNVTYARHIFMYVASKRTFQSNFNIAKYLNLTDQSTVVYGIKKVQNGLLRKDKTLQEDLNKLMGALR